MITSRTIQVSLTTVLALSMIGYFTSGVRTYKFQTEKSVYITEQDQPNLVRTQLLMNDNFQKIASSFYIVDQSTGKIVYRYPGSGSTNEWILSSKGYKQQNVALAIPSILPKGDYAVITDLSYQTPKLIKTDQVKIIDLKIPYEPKGNSASEYRVIKPLYYTAMAKKEGYEN